MHYECAVESYVSFHEKFGEKADFLFIKNWCLEPEMLAFAMNHCDPEIGNICKTITGMTGYQKPTDKQRDAIAHAMLSGRSASDILISIYGKKVIPLLNHMQRFDDADDVAEELFKHGIRLSDKRIAFGLMNEFVTEDQEMPQGNTYRASVQVIALLENIINDYDAYAKARVMGGIVGGELIALTAAEMKTVGLLEHDLLNFRSEAMELERYINLHYNGSHKDFAEAMGVAPSKVSEWKKLGWIAYKGRLWSSKRTLASNDSVTNYQLPGNEGKRS